MEQEVDQIKTRVIGIDIREKRTTYAVVNIRGEILALDYFMTSDYPEVSSYVAELCDRILTMAEESGGYETIRSVGISAPSANFLTGCIENAANMPWPTSSHILQTTRLLRMKRVCSLQDLAIS